VMHQILAPGMQHGQETDLRSQVLGIGRDGAQRLRRRPEQDIVDLRLVLERDDRDLMGHREDNMEVGHVEQFRLTVRQPLGASETLALRAVAIPTGNGRCPLAALGANSVMGSWRAAPRGIPVVPSALALFQLLLLSP
jgi:hypothetical protein